LGRWSKRWLHLVALAENKAAAVGRGAMGGSQRGAEVRGGVAAGPMISEGVGGGDGLA